MQTIDQKRQQNLAILGYECSQDLPDAVGRFGAGSADAWRAFAQAQIDMAESGWYEEFEFEDDDV